MKKIPTLFEREFHGKNSFTITERVHPGMEWVLQGEGIATTKYDGSCCAMIDGVFYKRYDAKAGKKPPEGAIPCCEPDPITGHWPHWVKVDWANPADKWFVEALNNTLDENEFNLRNVTYEAIGPHFNGNPHKLRYDQLEEHGRSYEYPERSFEGIKEYLRDNFIEGIVFWKDGQPQCKIKRSDFGFQWPVKYEA